MRPALLPSWATWALAILGGWSGLFGCSSTGTERTSALSQRLAGPFRMSKHTRAPLQDLQKRKLSADCKSVFRALLLDPVSAFGASNPTWETPPFVSLRGKGFPPPGTVRSYHLGTSRVAEKIVHWKTDRLVALSYLETRSAANWPFQDHLAIIRLQPSQSGCLMTWANHFTLPLRWHAVVAKNRLLDEVIPRSFERLSRVPKKARPDPSRLDPRRKVKKPDPSAT